MDTRLKNDIPIEGVVKWLVRERDRYKAKLEELIKYTKALEHQAIERKYDEIKRLESENKQLISQLEDLKAENKAYREDYKDSVWFHQIEANNKSLRIENKSLRAQMSALTTELMRVREIKSLDLVKLEDAHPLDWASDGREEFCHGYEFDQICPWPVEVYVKK